MGEGAVIMQLFSYMNEQKKNIFMRMSGLFKENALRVAIFLLFLLVFSWPYLSFLDQATPAQLFGYFFSAWLVLVVVLWASNSRQDDTNDKNK